MAFKLLVIGGPSNGRAAFDSAFVSGRWEVEFAPTRGAVGALAGSQSFNVACVDARVGNRVVSIATLLRRRLPRLPVIGILGSGDEQIGRQLREIGVRVFVTTPFSPDVLRQVVEKHALSISVGGFETDRRSSDVCAAASSLVAHDEAGKRMLEIALRAAASNVSILILGETGTGKTLLAQTIHEQSPLRNKPFVTVNCPSLNRELLESELFGHVRGAFTGAVHDTWGKVAAADGGTLFLDEIGELPAAIQPKLLRLLQEKQYERVGETTSRRANVRIIAATHRELKSEVEAGRFREDLFYRLNVITLEVPPLRCRLSDILPSAELFLTHICRQIGKPCPSLSTDARRLLEAYSWPGNLRELRNMVERAAVLSDGGPLSARDFPALAAVSTAPRFQVGADVSLRALEAAHIRMVIAKCATLEDAARILEIDKSTLYRKRKAMESCVHELAPAAEPVQAVGG